MAKISRRALAADGEIDGVAPYGTRPIPAAVRRAVEARDGMICRRCGCEVVRQRDCPTYQPNVLHIDHVIPWASGGPTTVENLIVTCGRCNMSRPRPKPVIRQCLVDVETDGWDYWWPLNFVPPNPVSDETRGLVSPTVAARRLGKNPAQVIRMAAIGRIPATTESPFLVLVPAELQKTARAKLTPGRRAAMERTEPRRIKRRRRARIEMHGLGEFQ